MIIENVESFCLPTYICCQGHLYRSRTYCLALGSEPVTTIVHVLGLFKKRIHHDQHADY